MSVVPSTDHLTSVSMESSCTHLLTSSIVFNFTHAAYSILSCTHPTSLLHDIGNLVGRVVFGLTPLPYPTQEFFYFFDKQYLTNWGLTSTEFAPPFPIARYIYRMCIPFDGEKLNCLAEHTIYSNNSDGLIIFTQNEQPIALVCLFVVVVIFCLLVLLLFFPTQTKMDPSVCLLL